ncbi:MAG TPA: outer membrane lipoprotein carrier protein LolA [Terracidiphilus sp.]|nr:outer membrane lipoprotein carrier protein LolA [Terracidiphilus sp.]
MTARTLPRRGLLLTAALLALPALAQPSPSAKPLTAQQLAQRVDGHYNHLHSLRAGFTQSYQGLGMSRTESGTLLLRKPGRMRWDYTSPAGKIFLLDGKYAWSYTPGDPQVTRIPVGNLDDLRTPLRFLLGHTQIEREIQHLRSAPAPSGEYTLSGQPKGQQRSIRLLALTVTAQGVITGIQIDQTDGSVTRFTFTGELPDAPAPPADFRFTPPPGIPVVNQQSPA